MHESRGCEGAPLFIAIRTRILIFYVRVAHLLHHSSLRGPRFRVCLVVRDHNRMMNDLDVRVRINKVDDHWAFGWSPSHSRKIGARSF
jgi:hypothetical protein